MIKFWRWCLYTCILSLSYSSDINVSTIALKPRRAAGSLAWCEDRQQEETASLVMSEGDEIQLFIIHPQIDKGFTGSLWYSWVNTHKVALLSFD